MPEGTGVGNGTEIRDRKTAGIAEVAAVAVFVLGLAAWLLASGSIALIVHEWRTYPDAGDAAIGLIIFGPAVLGVSLLLLLAAVFLSRRAKRLPKWFRALTVISPALGCLVGLAIIYRALGG